MRIPSLHENIEMNCLLCLVIISIVSIGIAQNCANDNVSLQNVKFTLFTPKTGKQGITLNEATYNNVNIKDRTTIIIHGFNTHYLIKPWVSLMKDTYLKELPGNIITVDWTAYTTGDNLKKAICATRRGVGRYVGDLIYNLTKVGVDVGKVQMNGCGMGAHVAGIAGLRVFELTHSKVWRINGLAAHRDGFLNRPAEERLDAMDANIVQAIHTDCEIGSRNHYGTIDFEVNYNSVNNTCGCSQPGCPGNSGIPNEGDSAKPFCSALRAAVYFIESIISKKFIGVKCPNDSCSDFGKGKCKSGTETIMGEMCPNDQSGVRFLNTNAMSPFSQGRNFF